jgi:hypothetical protein
MLSFATVLRTEAVGATNAARWKGNGRKFQGPECWRTRRLDVHYTAARRRSREQRSLAMD